MRRAGLAVGAAALLSLLLCAHVGEAVDLRGRVDARNPYNNTTHPLANAEVQLVSQGRTVSRTITGPDGFYYLQSVSPGPYQLLVNRQLRVSVTVAPRPFQDIAPILFVPR